MKRYFLFAFLLLPALVQADLLTDILSGEYKPKTMSSREQDSVLYCDTGKRYSLDYENKKQLFRRSFVADWYVVDNEKHTRKLLGGGAVRDPQISPNGKYIAFAKGNNIYLYKTDFGTEVAVTADENPNIINGVADWLYEEEFSTTALYAFSPDSKQLAFVRLDETEVPTFYWQNFLSEDGKRLTYPRIDSLRYPKAGEPNAKACVCVYDVQYKSIKTMQTGDDEKVYFPRLGWTNRIEQGKEVKEAELAILRLNRDQTKMDVLLANPKSTVSRTFYSEQSETGWVDYSSWDEWQWLSDNRLVLVSERSGWRQAFLYDTQGMLQRQLTTDGHDITAVYGFDEKTQTLFFQQATTPMTRQCFALNIKKNILTPLTDNNGIHSLRFSDDMTRYIDRFENIETPARYTLYKYANGKVQKEKDLLNNDALAAKWKTLRLNPMEFFSFVTGRGDTLNGWMLRPQGFDAAKKYPVVMLQYSGPESQRVLNQWRKNWEQYLAEQGFLVVCVDGRGTGGRGTAFRHATYMELGQKEAEDQISAALYLQTLPFVDGKRMCIGGWSYGGFETLMTMSQPNSPFLCGIAIAPVTDYRLYDSAYTERYMRRPQVNDRGYRGCSLPDMAENLKGDLLLVHGLSDDNVHAQQTMLYVDALVQAGKQFEMQIYPDDNHFLKRRANYEHLHRRIMKFLEREMCNK